LYDSTCVTVCPSGYEVNTDKNECVDAGVTISVGSQIIFYIFLIKTIVSVTSFFLGYFLDHKDALKEDALKVTPLRYEADSPLKRYESDSPLKRYESDSPLKRYESDSPLKRYESDSPLKSQVKIEKL